MSLCLSREKGQIIVITDTISNERIYIKAIDILYPKMRIGVSASRRFTIHRLEIQDRIDLDAANLKTKAPPPELAKVPQ